MADPVPPVAVALRPLTIAEMLDRAVSLTVRWFVVLAGISLVYSVPLVIFEFFAGTDYSKLFTEIARASAIGGTAGQEAVLKVLQNPSYGHAFSPWMIAFVAIAAVVSPLPTAALLWANAALYARGGHPTFRDAYRAALRAWLPLILIDLLWVVCGGLAYLAALLIIVIAIFIAALVAVASQVVGIVIGVALGLIALAAITIAGSAVMIAIYMSYLAIIVEGMSFANAFSSALTRVFAHSFRRAVLAGLTVVAVSIGAALLAVGGSMLAVALLHSEPVGAAFNALVNVVVGLFVSMFLTITYYDILVRTEGFDLRAEFAAQTANAGVAPG